MNKLSSLPGDADPHVSGSDEPVLEVRCLATVHNVALSGASAQHQHSFVIIL